MIPLADLHLDLAVECMRIPRQNQPEIKDGTNLVHKETHFALSFPMDPLGPKHGLGPVLWLTTHISVEFPLKPTYTEPVFSHR